MAEKWADGAKLNILCEVLWTEPAMPNISVMYRRDCADVLNLPRTHVLATLCPTREYVSVYELAEAKKLEADGRTAVGLGAPSVSYVISDDLSVTPRTSVDVVGIEEGRKRIRELVFGASTP